MILLGTHWVTEMLSLIYANGKVDDVDRDQTGGALEFGDFHAGTAIQAREERPAPTYVQAQTWKSPRVITSHVLEEFLPQQLKEGKGKVPYNSRAAKPIHAAHNVKTVRLCTEFNKSINNIFLICHILWHFQDGRHWPREFNMGQKIETCSSFSEKSAKLFVLS